MHGQCTVCYRTNIVEPFHVVFIMLHLYLDTELFIHYSLGDVVQCSPISRGHLSPNNSRKTVTPCPWERGIGAFHEFEMWPKFYLRSCCAVDKNMLHCTMYRQSIIVITKVESPNACNRINSWAHVRLLSGEFHRKPLVISQHWFKQWLSAVRQQPITCANVDTDLWRHMASLGCN